MTQHYAKRIGFLNKREDLTHEEFVGYLKGNILKYALRQGKKQSDDAGKAKHYMQKLEEIR